MKIKKSKSRMLFLICNYIFLTVLTISCMIPILNQLAMSFSSSSAIIGNKVSIFPVEFTLSAYNYVMNNVKFWTSLWVSIKRVLVGVPIQILMAILVAYPLSKSERVFPERKYYVRFMLFNMLFSGGLMPTYFIIAKIGLIDTIWALIIPGAVPISNCIILLNFFRGVPEELEESATLDGANHFQIMARIYLPISKPSIATITLFSLVGHWNAWFDGLIYSNYTQNYPLQSYLQTLVVSKTEVLETADLQTIIEMTQINDTNMKAAMIFITIIPLMLVYPFLQKYFTTGLTVGSVKG